MDTANEQNPTGPYAFPIIARISRSILKHIKMLKDLQEQSPGLLYRTWKACSCPALQQKFAENITDLEHIRNLKKELKQNLEHPAVQLILTQLIKHTLEDEEEEESIRRTIRDPSPQKCKKFKSSEEKDN